MKKIQAVRTLLSITVLLLATTHRGAAQGPITPSGAPTVPVMKTLDQVEPRIPIPGSGSYVIETPGSYYLTGNITAGANNGITIYASNVTLDLSGYTITCDAVANIACITGSFSSNLAVRNGTLTGGSNGVIIHSVSGTKCVQLDSLRISGCARNGITSPGAVAGLVISNCIVAYIGNGAASTDDVSGIFTNQDAVVKNCEVDTVVANGGNCSGIYTYGPSVVQDCSVNTVINHATATLAAGIRLTSGSLAVSNRVLKSYFGILGGKYQNNATAGCTTAFSSGTDGGGNN